MRCVEYFRIQNSTRALFLCIEQIFFKKFSKKMFHFHRSLIARKKEKKKEEKKKKWPGIEYKANTKFLFWTI